MVVEGARLIELLGIAVAAVGHERAAFVRDPEVPVGMNLVIDRVAE